MSVPSKASFLSYYRIFITHTNTHLKKIVNNIDVTITVKL